jgi:hypothetical protein
MADDGHIWAQMPHILHFSPMIETIFSLTPFEAIIPSGHLAAQMPQLTHFKLSIRGTFALNSIAWYGQALTQTMQLMQPPEHILCTMAPGSFVRQRMKVLWLLSIIFITSNGHTWAHLPQPTHFSSLMRGRKLSTISIAPTGQTLTQSCSPTHP